MNKSMHVAMVVALLAGAGAIIDPRPAFSQASATVGSIRGVVKDAASNGAGAAGATVVATSPALQGQQVIITDENGQYFITALPPGAYTLTVHYLDSTVSRANILVQIGKEAVVNIDFGSAANKGKTGVGEVIEISGTAPIVDQGSTKIGTTITQDYTNNIPSSRTFGGVIGQAAGAQDNYNELGPGISIAGSTNLENIYIIDGLNTTDTGYGGIASDLPTEFIRETEIITGGYNAEYGRSTGGIVNVVTKSGSNQFHGSVFGYWRPGRLVAAARTVESEAGAIARASDLDYKYDFGAEVGGPIIKDKLWFHVGFNPSIAHSTETRYVQSFRDANQDGLPDVDPDTGLSEHEAVSQSAIPAKYRTYYFTAKLNGALDQNHQFQLSAFGNPASDRPTTTSFIGNPQYIDKYISERGAYDFAGKWTSKLNDGSTQIDALAGYHRGRARSDLADSAPDLPLVSYSYDRSLYDFADLEGANAIAACQDSGPGDKYPLISNCPVSGYSESGLGFLERATRSRMTGILSVTQRVKLAGYHVFKAGVDAELARYKAQKRYSGGSILTRYYDPAAGEPSIWEDSQFMNVVRNLTPDEVMAPGGVALGPGQLLCAHDRAICEIANQISAETDHTSIGAFLQDSWQILPNLTVNLGLRYENQIGYASKQLQGQVTPEGEIVPKRVYNLNDLWSPRAGIIYDPTGEGRSKLFGHWGRFYENIPMDLQVRNFGGEYINFNLINSNRRSPGDVDYDPNCNADHNGANIDVASLKSCNDVFTVFQSGGPASYLAPGLRGQYTDELIVGTEYEIMPNLKVGMSYIHRSMPNVIEDISTDGGNSYVITNPGRDFSEAAAKLRQQALAELASPDPAQQALGHLHENQAQQLESTKQFEKPVRNYDAIQITATQRPSQRSLLLASYTYSASRGNYPGLASSETGQADPNNTSLYDLPDLMANRYGPLGLDRPHNLKIDGFYQFDLRTIGLVTTGASFRAQSGIAHNALAASPHFGYGVGESFLLPRGAIARSPVTHQVDVHVSYGRRMPKGTMIEGFVRVFNLFNQQDELNTDENYTYEAVNPIVGGTISDLKHAKVLDQTGIEVNRSPTVNKNFGHSAPGANGRGGPALQLPRAIEFGMRVSF